MSDHDQFRVRAQVAEQKLNQIYSSPFWRFSKPLRVLMRRLGCFKTSKAPIDPQISLSDKSKDKEDLVVNQISTKIHQIFGSAEIKSKKIAVLAHWSDDSKIDMSSEKLVLQLIDCDFEVVIASGNTSLNIDNELLQSKKNLHIIVKPNIGYDFGSWLGAIIKFPEILGSDELILVNSSVIGPFGNLSTHIDQMRDSRYEITSLTDSCKLNYHLQSYFLHLKASALRSDTFSDFFYTLPVLENKFSMISRYEIGFTNRMQGAGLLCGSLYPWNLYSTPWDNPTIDGAMKLIEDGFPFIKKEALRLLSSQEKKELLKIVNLLHSDSSELLDTVN